MLTVRTLTRWRGRWRRRAAASLSRMDGEKFSCLLVSLTARDDLLEQHENSNFSNFGASKPRVALASQEVVNGSRST